MPGTENGSPVSSASLSLLEPKLAGPAQAALGGVVVRWPALRPYGTKDENDLLRRSRPASPQRSAPLLLQ